ncbi:MAG TPA: hypothetical protein VFR37_09190 [Longimicrobium sp.]|nr:hypothetical protein [Longimicrobium sp.]
MPVAPDAFYLPETRPLLSQGDVYLAPTVVVWSEEAFQAIPLVPPAPEEPGALAFIPAWARSSAPFAPPVVTLATRWAPVLVLSHDCEIDKEFNEHVDALVREGVPEPEAMERAGGNPELDRYILVSPLLPFQEQELAQPRWDSVRAGQKIGYFPLPPMPAYEDTEYFVHLSRICTVERRLLSPAYKAASLSEQARSLLRFKLAEALSSRSISVVSKLEAAIGQRIADVRTLKIKRQDVTVMLVLEDGSEVQVGARADQEPPVPERTRPSV